MIDFINAQRKLQKAVEEEKSFNEPSGCNETKKGMAKLCDLIKNGASTTDELVELSGYSRYSIFSNIRGLKKQGVIDTVKEGKGNTNRIIWIGGEAERKACHNKPRSTKTTKETIQIILDKIKEFGFVTRKDLLDIGVSPGVVICATKKLKKEGVIYSKKVSGHRPDGNVGMHYLLREC
jgi:ribosomal protein S25